MSTAPPLTLETLFKEHSIRILDSIFDGILIIDTDSTVLYVNPEYLRIVQIRFDDIVGKPLRAVRPGAMLPDVVLSGNAIEGALRREGAIEYVADMSPIICEGCIVGGISVVKDVTEIQKLSTELHHFQRSNKRLRSSLRQINAARYTFDGIVTRSPSMNETILRARNMAGTNTDIMLTGESGTGKELFAQSIHNASLRSRGPFLALNCATLAPGIIESELFGYGDGAFTGAKRGGKAGFFEVAEGGTLFLDEITELPLSAQAKLLRVLQERRVRRVGETDEIPMNVRIITASNRNLEKLVAENRFRSDLFYRLNTLHLPLPALRERKEDIEPLALAFFSRFIGQSGEQVSLSPYVCRIFHDYPWPGNVRELRNMVEYAVHMGAKTSIEATHLLPQLFASPLSKTVENAPPSGAERSCGTQTLAAVAAEAEKGAIAQKLQQHGKTLSAKRTIAQELGVSLTTLYDKINKYAL